ncbi:glycosyltransferase [Sunxiuqinia sp. A32]|uniref:glycosyltransferase n=1 Tax=Sunxiuqinia sp. A32 TaxID=3461496 RepID=UPI0040465A88
MKLSVVIVNYNVKFFLEQCLHSVQKACAKIDSEIFVVDNNSVDGSCQMVKDKFPTVHIIENYDNRGFSKANNQGIQIAKGEYILLLNPDTIVEEDSFIKCVQFMDAHTDAGALGVKMIDGKGQFLPESKRGLPTPAVAFYKIFGFSKLFSKSKRFGRYHLGHLSKEEIHEIDILSGAYMLLRKSVIDEVGMLDEDYFMYGEDIDLSYRITQAGYKNYYFPETTIIHYKGESTKKGSINYVKVFYNAMIIFANKHFSKGRADMFSLLINLAIYFRAFLAVINRLAKNAFLPILDALIIYTGYLWLLPYWEQYQFTKGHFPPEYLNFIVPVYILIWIFSIWFIGGYQKPIKIIKFIQGLFWGSIAILVAYSLVDESYRFSRALIILGSFWALGSLLLDRLLLNRIKPTSFRFDLNRKKKVVVISSKKEADRINNLIQQSQLKIDVCGLVHPSKEKHDPAFLGNLSQLAEIIQIHKIEELIFSASNLSSQEIIATMLDLASLKIEYKIAPPKSLSIIGSSSIDTAGELYVVNLNAITKDENQRNKRIIDFLLGIFFLATYPFICWTVKNKIGLLRNIFLVLIAKKSWVGFAGNIDTKANLPTIKDGVLTPTDQFEDELPEAKKLEIDMGYAKNYRILQDIEIIIQSWKKLGQ